MKTELTILENGIRLLEDGKFVTLYHMETYSGMVQIALSRNVDCELVPWYWSLRAHGVGKTKQAWLLGRFITKIHLPPKSNWSETQSSYTCHSLDTSLLVEFISSSLKHDFCLHKPET